MRGVWVDAFGPGLRSVGQIEQLVAWAAQARLDAIVAQVVRRGDAFANLLPLPRADGDLDPAPFDPLATLCERAHAVGIGVHAWLGATPVAQGTDPDPRHLPWLSRRHDGAARDRHDIAHLDPGHPEARDFVATCAAAVAERYPVDGVNLDRVRYPESSVRGAAEWGYNPVALQRFAAETEAPGPPDPVDPAWQDWRRAQVGALVAETAARVRGVRDDVVFTTTGTCFGGLEAGWEASRPWVECAQDWPGWLQDGLVDRVLVMNYRGDADDADLVTPAPDVDVRAEGAVATLADPAVLQARFDAWASLAVRAGGGRAVLGTGLYLQDTRTNLAQVEAALRFGVDGTGPGGWCGYSYRTPSRLVLRGERSAAEERADLAAGLRGLA